MRWINNSSDLPTVARLGGGPSPCIHLKPCKNYSICSSFCILLHTCKKQYNCVLRKR
ncbi:MAG: hypothetical protein E6968_13705 [Peptostreptococcaceae bacterium]|nr:hypothetical protein [Peptostreptococcaceae bacterium]